MNSLPPEILADLFEWLSLAAFFRIRLVCREWCGIASRTSRSSLISFNRRMLAIFDRSRSKSLMTYFADRYQEKLRQYRKASENYPAIISEHRLGPEFKVVKYYYAKWGHLSFTLALVECGEILYLLNFKKKRMVWWKTRQLYGVVEDGHIIAENSNFSHLFEQLLREEVTI